MLTRRAPNLPLHAQRRLVSQLVLGIRREDPRRLWERRCPLTPDAIAQLVREDGVRVLVQPCDRRVYPERDFLEAGASMHPTLSPAHIVLGIKETPIAELEGLSSPVGGAPRTHVMFSHTAKGQPYNLPLLSKFLEGPGSPTLIDYELMTDGTPADKRLVGFGWFAGVSGLVEGLCASAHAHLEQGIASPFLQFGRPYTYSSLDAMRAALRSVTSSGIPPSLAPFVIALTGSGNVAQGALAMLSELPHVRVRASDLPALVQNAGGSEMNQVYVVHVQPGDYLFHKHGSPYDRAAYYANPGEWQSRFHELIAPYISLLVNGTGWRPGFPRLMTKAQLALALRTARSIGPSRFRSVADISCDLEVSHSDAQGTSTHSRQGGLEFSTKTTSIDSPYYTAAPEVEGGIQVMGVDILPTELPRDASLHFSGALLPFIRTLVRGEPSDVLERATIASGGRLRERHRWLEPAVEAWRGRGHVERKTIVMLGAGMVAGPAVEEILKRGDVRLVVASNVLREAEALVDGHERGEAVLLDVGDGEKLDGLIKAADVVISLLPAPMHTSIAERCITHKRHLVTASYISPEMRMLDVRARAADVLLLNEIGLDPGIDHCSARELVERASAESPVVAFTSFCGGLPAPECAEHTGGLGYKFSWNPRGALEAMRRAARYKLGGTMYTVPGEELLARGRYFARVPVPGAGALALEGLPNRDSIPYAGPYGLGQVGGLRTLIRGTLRYQGFCDMMHAFKAVGLMESEERGAFALNGEGWRALLPRALGTKVEHGFRVGDEASVRGAVRDLVEPEVAEDAVSALEWMGLIGEARAEDLPKPLPGARTAIDHLAALAAHKLRYLPGERDLVVLAHEVATAGGAVFTSSLVVYGDGASAMARCVGVPVACAALRVLDGKVGDVVGVRGPEGELARGVMQDLGERGMGMRESVRRSGAGVGKVEGALMVGRGVL